MDDKQEGSFEALAAWGWDLGWKKAFDSISSPGLVPGRVIDERRGAFRVATEREELVSRAAGRLRFNAVGRTDLPAVGDWVGVEPRWSERTATVRAVLPRRTKLSRRAAGAGTLEQVLAANVDTVFIVTSLNRDLKARRIERYLAMAYEGKTDPVVLMNKADLHESPDEAAASIAPLGAPVLALSARTGQGLESLSPWLLPGCTVALVGSSGVGKSTLINRLLGREALATLPVRGTDDRGRHATNWRQLLRLPGGALLIDTPGLRELAVWGSGSGSARAFSDVEVLAASCRFSDCGHGQEPGCAVREALESGRLDPGRWNNFLKMRKEDSYLERRRDIRAELDFKKKMKRRAKDIKEVYRTRKRQ